MRIIIANGTPIILNVSDSNPYDTSSIWVTGLKSTVSLEKREETLNEVIAVYRRTKHGGIAISPLEPIVTNSSMSKFAKRDFGTDQGYYTNGGTVLLECQYGLGADSLSSTRWGSRYDAMLNDAGEGHTLHWRMTALHGYIGSNTRLKCATKVYQEYQSDDSWRDWGDVWSSF